jgi:hypothetical protein
MLSEFQFVDDGRTFTCKVEKPRAPRTESWWWFGVSGDGHRYAPFQADAKDTQKSVQARIVAYYNEHLARRAAPAMQRQHWSQRGKGVTPAAKAGAAATPAAPAPAK